MTLCTMHFTRLHFSCVWFHGIKREPCLWTGDTWIYLMGAPPGEVGIGWMVTVQSGHNIQAEITDEWYSSWVSTGTMTISLLVTSNSGTEFWGNWHLSVFCYITETYSFPYCKWFSTFITFFCLFVSFCLLNSQVLTVPEGWADSFLY